MVKRWDLQGYSFVTERGQYVKHSDYAQQEIALHHWIDVAGGYRCRIDQLQSELDVLGGVHTHSPGCEKTALCRMTNEHDRLRAELTEARKPDCHSCNWFKACDVSCVLEGGESECVNGDCYERADTLRLYEKGGK